MTTDQPAVQHIGAAARLATLPAASVVDLYCGGGGASLGLHRSGLAHVAAIDSDASACATLASAMGGSLLGRPHPAWSGGADRGVVRCLDIDDWRPVAAHVWWASPPCQPFSTSGSRAGETDVRNGYPRLWRALDRAADLGIAPTWLLSEQVPGILMHSGACRSQPTPGCTGCYWHHRILPELGRRFASVTWGVVDAADLGVPQHRRRVLIAAGPRAVEMPRPTHSALALVEAQASGAYAAACEAAAWTYDLPRGSDGLLPHETVRRALRIAYEPAQFGAEGGPWVESQVGRDVGRGPRGPCLRSADAPSYAVTASPGYVTYDPDWWHRASPPDGSARTVGGRGNAALTLARGRRRLTLSECAVLQGLPRDWPLQGTAEDRYRQVGNAVPPAMAEALAHCIR
jgi:DNA (cytosine-5)-methyltransferase 1